MKVAITRNSALVVVDVQRDFMPGGALPVPKGDLVIGPINTLIARFKIKGLPVIFTRDWHPPDHISFQERGGPWPPHCIKNTKGAEFHPDMEIPEGAIIVSKATERDKEAYSGFQGTNLNDILREKGIKRIFLGGVATEYCVKATVLDALNLGYEVIVVEEAIKGISEDEEVKARDSMLDEGSIFAALSEIKM